jgi:hypothetical protein
MGPTRLFLIIVLLSLVTVEYDGRAQGVCAASATSDCHDA